MDRAVIYARVSSDEQAEGHSLNSQVEHCQRYCEQKGYAVTKTYREDFTGTTATRPLMNELLLNHELFDVMVVYQVDRLARSRSAMVVIEMELEKHGKRSEFVVGNFDATPEGNLFKNLMVDFAQFDRENLLRRVSSGKLGRLRAGNIQMAHPLFGYNYVKSERGGKYEINEVEAEWVRKIFTWYVKDGHSILRIAKMMTDLQVATKGDKIGTRTASRYGMWHDNTVSRVLKNKAYAGEWTYGGKGIMPQVKVSIPPIVDEELFDAAQKARARNKQLARRNTREFYLMRGRMRCAHCNYMYNAVHKDRPNGKHSRYYRCKGAFGSPKDNWDKVCKGILKADVVDGAVWDFVKERILHPEMVIEGLREKNEIIKNSTAQFRTLAQSLEEQLVKLDDKRMRLLDLFADDKIPKPDLERAVAENVRESATARQRLIELRGALGEEQPQDPNKVRAFLESLVPGAEDATSGERERVVADLDIFGVVSVDKKTIIINSPYISGVVVIE